MRNTERRIWLAIFAALVMATGARVSSGGSEQQSFPIPLVEIQGGTNQTTYATGDILYASGSNALSKLGIGSSTNVLTVSGGIPAWSAASGGGATGTVLYGDGSDGSVTWDGSTTLLGLAPSSNVYTLTRDICLTSSTVNNGVTIITANFRIFGTGTLTNNGTIKCDGGAGGNASGTTAGGAGTNIATQIFTASGPGGAGGAGSGANGSAGSATSSTIGGSGGRGGDAGANTGGAAGAATAPTAASGSWHAFPSILAGEAMGAGTHRSGGAGGSGGAGTGSHGGGGGGGGGGVLMIAFKTITNTSGTISANGGAGGNGDAGTGGRGAGGGGGDVVLIYNTFSGNAATATHGANGTGSATNATTAADGTVVTVSNNQ